LAELIVTFAFLCFLILLFEIYLVISFSNSVFGVVSLSLSVLIFSDISTSLLSSLSSSEIGTISLNLFYRMSKLEATLVPESSGSLRGTTSIWLIFYSPFLCLTSALLLIIDEEPKSKDWTIKVSLLFIIIMTLLQKLN
jgi:hypothetical protein